LQAATRGGEQRVTPASPPCRPPASPTGGNGPGAYPPAPPPPAAALTTSSSLPLLTHMGAAEGGGTGIGLAQGSAGPDHDTKGREIRSHEDEILGHLDACGGKRAMKSAMWRLRCLSMAPAVALTVAE